MADETTTPAPPLTLKGAILGMNPRIALAFYLVAIAGSLVVWLGIILKGLDAGTAALIAGLVTLFVKMADSSVNYQYQSSAGSDKKDDTNAVVQKALAEKVPAPPAAIVAAPTVVVAWWSLLTDEERAAIEAYTPNPRVLKFIEASKIGKATPDDLTYLVSLGLLTQDRATAIQSA